MQKTPLLLFILYSLLTIAVKAQTKADNVWCFGINVEMDFNSGSPILIDSCNMNTTEGCASVADKNTGKLLFYTDGSYVWNRNNDTMPNNIIPLGGNGSSSQSALIVPMPAFPERYYIFTVPAEVGYSSNNVDSGLNFSIIDMSLNGSLGDVGQQPQSLIAPTTEALTGTRMANDSGYWVVVHQWNTDAFYTYPITSSGIGSPVISHAGFVHHDDTQYNYGWGAVGMMKISPDRKKIADGITEYFHSLQVLNFNDTTGEISGTLLIDRTILNTHYGFSMYAISFSPNSSLLYGTASDYDSSVYQYNLEAGDTVAVLNSRNIIGKSRAPNALQLAPDGKMYVAEFYDSTLNVIENPDIYGIGCNFHPRWLSLNHKLCLLGLPNFMDCDFVLRKTDDGIPANSNLNFALYPNPTSNNCTISLRDSTQKISAELFDITGRKIVNLFEGLDGTEFHFNTSQLQKGIYLIKLTDVSKGTSTIKLIKE